jgi:hypothetical protein
MDLPETLCRPYSESGALLPYVCIARTFRHVYLITLPIDADAKDIMYVLPQDPVGASVPTEPIIIRDEGLDNRVAHRYYDGVTFKGHLKYKT